MVHVPFSYIKKTSSGFSLVNVPHIEANPSTIEHSYGDGAVNGVQMHVVKIKAGSGACTIQIVPNNGQNLIAGFSFNRDSVKSWVSSAGGTTQNVAVEVGLGSATITKVIDDPVTADVYVWFGVGINGSVGSGTGSSNSYTLTYSGNFHDPEVLFITGNAPVGVPTGTYGNPALVNPNDSATYSSTNGDCISGAYYFTMSVSSYVTRTITLTPDQGAPVGLIVSSNKAQLQAWINNGGSGSLTDGYNSPYTGDGSSDLTVTIYPENTQTLYAAYFDPSNVGVNSCGVGHDIIISSHEDYQGQNSGTYASPFTIDNNTSPLNATTVYRSQGECTHGAVYYEFAACANANLGVSANPSNGQYVGIGISYSKDNLAQFLLTQNYSLLDADYEGYGNSGGSGGGGSNCGSFANPSDPSNSDYNSYYGQHFINSSYDTWVLDTGSSFFGIDNLPNGCSTCGFWDNPTNIPFSGYYDVAGNYYSNQGENTWYDSINSVLITDKNNLPDYSAGADTNGYFSNAGDRSNTDYYDTQAGWVYYTNYGYNLWMQGSYLVSGQANLPDYCAGGGGGSGGSTTHDLTFSPPNDGTYYVIIYDPNNIGSDSCGDSSQFKVSTEQLNCGGGGAGADGTYPHPYVYSVNDYNSINRLFKEGDCNEGKVWFMFSGFCRAPAQLQVNSNYGGGLVVWSETKEAIYNWFFNGQSGDLGVHGGSTSLNTNTNIYVDGLTSMFVCVYHGGGNQCSNSSDTFGINLFAYNCGDFGNPGNPSQPANHNDPIVIKNNDNRSTWRSAGECTYGTLFYQSLICEQPFTINASDVGNIGIAWANDINALYTWVTHHGAWSHDLSEFDGGHVEPTSTSNTATFTPTAQATYYIALYRENFADTCAEAEFVNINTSQSDCNGAGNSAGTYQSPLTVGNNATANVDISTGDCFEGSTYFSLVKCADNPLTITMTAGDGAHQQGIIWGDSLNYVKQALDYYFTQGIDVAPGWSGSIDIGSNMLGSGQPVTTIPSKPNQKTMYFVTFDLGSGRGTPRCARNEQTTLVMNQTCPVIIVGGTSNLSGAANYAYDPFNVGHAGNGIALSVSDPAASSLRSLLFSPTLAIDAHGEYPPITCSNIEISMYSNDISGATKHIVTDNVTYTEVVVQNPADSDSPVLIKPRTGHEFLISNADFYTSVIKVTFETNIGNIVRTQVINQGGAFGNGRYQYSYITSKDTENIHLIVPSAQNEIHHIKDTSSISASKNGHNEFTFTVPFQINAGEAIGLPFFYPNSSIQNQATIRIPANAANISGVNNAPPDYSDGVGDAIIFVPPTVQGDGPLHYLDGAYEPLNYDLSCDGACTCRFDLPPAAFKSTTTTGVVNLHTHGGSCTCQSCPDGMFFSAISYGISLYGGTYDIVIDVPSLGIHITEVCVGGQSRFIPVSTHSTLSAARSVPATITWTRHS